MTRSVAQIRKAGLCAGCGMCAGLAPAGAIVMEESAEGFLRPRVTGSLDPALDHVIEGACPAVAIRDPRREADGEPHPTWGAIAALRYAWASDEQLRHLGSSGAALSAMLAFLVETGKVDHVIATAMSPQVPIRNVTVRLTNLDDVRASAGSRYAPSAPLAEIGRLLDEDRTFAFVGKPCDVAALRQLARIDSRVNLRVPWMFSFFCAGLPSYRGTDVLLKALGVPEGAELSRFRFRGEGWPGLAKAVTSDGQSYEMDYDSSWGRILNRHIQFRCKICPDGIGEFADIAFADGWHLDARGIASFAEAPGRSLAVIRKSTALALFEEAREAGYLVHEPASIDDLPAMQPHQATRKGFVPVRLAAYKLVGHRLPRFTGLDLAWHSRRASLASQGRNFVGALRRLIRNRTEN